jgi:MFS family permease
MTAPTSAIDHKIFTPTVLIASLGYLVDMFDMFVFNIVRKASLTDLGLAGPALTQAGLDIANCQWCGLLIGAYVWGVLGDRIGRKKALLSSVIIYSLGSPLPLLPICYLRISTAQLLPASERRFRSAACKSFLPSLP